MKVGNFEFDLESGQLRFKVSVILEGSKLVPTIVENMVFTSLTISDNYFNTVMQVCYGGKTASQALEDKDNSGKKMVAKMFEFDTDHEEEYEDKIYGIDTPDRIM